ncbi:MAG: VTT domain-containing protein [Pirellulales bacterium]|nr:VTT domain-containing protein [Pirellulales bacterium]
MPDDALVQNSGRLATMSERPLVGRVYLKLAILLLMGSGFVVGWILLRDRLALNQLVECQRMLSEYACNAPFMVWGGAFLLYVVATGVSLPIGPPLKVLYGAVFGFVPAVILVSFAATLGALMAFTSSRYLIKTWVQNRLTGRLARVNSALEREGSFYLCSLRLFPITPFFVINLVMGVTPMRVWTFCWVSWLGMLPITCAYVFAGASVDFSKIAESGMTGLLSWPFVMALALLAVAPLVLRFLWLRFRARFPQAARL